MSVLDRFRLDGRTAVVTGYRRGIGRATAIALAEAGADLIGIGSSAAPGEDMAEAVRHVGRRFVSIRADLAERADIDRALADVASPAMPVVILINNAGIIRRGPVCHSRGPGLG